MAAAGIKKIPVKVARGHCDDISIISSSRIYFMGVPSTKIGRIKRFNSALSSRSCVTRTTPGLGCYNDIIHRRQVYSAVAMTAQQLFYKSASAVAAAPAIN